MEIAHEETSFQLVGGTAPLILVSSYVNSTGPYNFILDSGAARCLISPQLASHLGIHAEYEEDGAGAGGELRLSHARVPSLAVGAAQQEDTQCLITHDLERIGAALKMTVDGAIGFTFMRNFTVTLDYQRRVLSFVRASGACGETRRPTSCIPFTLVPSQGFIQLQAFANGQGPFQFIVDTGARRSVISPKLAARLRVQSEKAVVGLGVGGQVPMVRAKLDSLTVGDSTVQDQRVAIGEFVEAISATVGVELDGIIGNDFLCQFHVTLDYLQSRLSLAASQLL